MACQDLVSSLLSPLGLYRLGQGSLLDAELAAYRTGFAWVQQAAEKLGQNAFVQTADEQALAGWEALLGLPLRRGVAHDARRQRILSSLAVTPQDFTPQGVLASLRGAGLAAQLEEFPQQQRIRIIGQGFIGGFDTIYDVMESAARMLPAHLEAEFDIGGMTWEQFEQLYPRWTAFDDALESWEAFDTALI